MTPLTLFFLLFLLPQEVPFKPAEEFEIKLDLSFRQKPPHPSTKVELNETRAEHEKRTSSTPLPYIKLKLNILKPGAGEVRVKIIRDGNQLVMNRKYVPGKELLIDVGFSDDVKDQISGYEYLIYFLTAQKKEQSRIRIEFTEEGDYLVNGVKRGRI